MDPDSEEIYGRNLESLLRRGAMPVGAVRLERSRAAFLARLKASPREVAADVPSRHRYGRWMAMAASLLAAAGVLWSMGGGGGPVPEQVDAPVPEPPRAAQERAVDPGPGSEGTARAPVSEPASSYRSFGSVQGNTKEMSLALKAPSRRSGTSRVVVEGRSSLPDGAELAVTVGRRVETIAGGRIVSSERHTLLSRATVQAGRFRFPVLLSTGAYVVRMRLRGSVEPPPWSFELSAWRDDLARRLQADAGSAEELLYEARALLAEFRDACVSEATWKAARDRLVSRVEGLKVRFAEAQQANLCAAVTNEAGYAVRTLAGTCASFRWKDGAFVAESYHFPDGRARTHRNEPFAFETLLRYVGECLPLLGRETALWMVRDVRRAGRLTPGMRNLLRRFAGRPGFAPYAERLSRGPDADLDALERGIREGRP